MSRIAADEWAEELDAAGRHEPRNFVVLAAHQVVLRTGWIFKTESIVMPMVLDALGGSGWLRGCLPLLNRFGHSVPPMLAARRIKQMQRKKWALLATVLLMALCFLTLSAVWNVAGPGTPSWMPAMFLATYAVFFMCTGVNQVVFNTIQGKLIRATHRGRLMMAANLFGAISAITFAAWLMPRWLSVESAQFANIFLVSAVSFALAAVISLALVEHRDHYELPEHQQERTPLVRRTAALLRHDRNFRRLAIVAALFGSSIMLFPHYQALARGSRVGLDMTNMMVWVVVQNAGTALFSFVVGPVADRRGNRVVLQTVLLLICAAPLVAIGLSYLGHWGQVAFPLVFLLVGLTPVAIRIFAHYTLEIADPADHPQYLSTLNLCTSAPAVLSPLTGSLIDVVGFDVVFLAIAALVACGWLVSRGLVEPRHGSP